MPPTASLAGGLAAVIHSAWKSGAECSRAKAEKFGASSRLLRSDYALKHSRVPSCRIRGDCGRRSAVLDAELGVDLLEMLVDRTRAKPQDLRDVAVGLALGEPRQHFALPRGEPEFA